MSFATHRDLGRRVESSCATFSKKFAMAMLVIDCISEGKWISTMNAPETTRTLWTTGQLFSTASAEESDISKITL